MYTHPAHPNKQHRPTSQSIKKSRHIQVSKHFTKVQNQLTYASQVISDGAYRTYVVLLSFDYQDSATRRYKGAVTLSIEELSKLRGKGRSTLYNHLQELTEAGLVGITPAGIQLFQVAEEDAEGVEAVQPTVPVVDNASEASVQKTGRDIKELEEDVKHRQIQYSEVKDEVVVLKLMKLGFDGYLARSFVSRYGPKRVDRQVTNLCLAMQRGQSVRSYPRWLYTAIERNYAVDAVRDEHRRKKRVYEELAVDEASGVITIFEHEGAERAD